jgi:hypothetical protein
MVTAIITPNWLTIPRHPPTESASPRVGYNDTQVLTRNGLVLVER